MDTGIAILNVDTGIAILLGAMIGGLIGFASSYFGNLRTLAHSSRLAMLSKQTESIEGVFLILFRSLSGEKLDHDTWNHYIIHCLWLPPKVRSRCLEVLTEQRDPDKMKSAQKAVMALSDTLTRGSV